MHLDRRDRHVLSAYFILAANSLMQNPVGFTVSTPTTGRAELTDFGAVLTNKVALVTFPHTIARRLHDRRRRSSPASRSGTSSGTRTRDVEVVP